LQIGMDDDSIGVTVIDLIGSLKPNQVLARLAAIHRRQIMLGLDGTEEGSGLGLAMIMRSGGSLYFAGVHGQRTEVTALFRRRRGTTSARGRFQFVSTRLLAPVSSLSLQNEGLPVRNSGSSHPLPWPDV